MLDLRIPIGLYFVINSVLLIVAGSCNGSLSMVNYGKQALNLNLCWAVVLGVFGLFMIALSYMEKKKKRSRPTLRSMLHRQTRSTEETIALVKNVFRGSPGTAGVSPAHTPTVHARK
jgi:hypothetical protein